MALDQDYLFAGSVDEIVFTPYGGGTPSSYYYTVGGVEIVPEHGWVDLECDQVPGIAGKKRFKFGMVLSFAVPELEKHKGKIAFAQCEANAASTFLYLDNQAPQEWDIEIKIPPTGGTPRLVLIHFFRCVPIGGESLAVRNSEQTVFRQRFAILPDAGMANRLGRMKFWGS